MKQDIRLETRRFGTLTTILKGSGQLNSLLQSPLHTQAHKASHLSIKEKPAGSMLGSIFSPNTPRILICFLVLGSPRLIHQYAMYYISKTLIDFEKKHTPLEKTCQIRDQYVKYSDTTLLYEIVHFILEVNSLPPPSFSRSW